MFAVLGITGQVGSAVARNLLAQDKSVRAVVRAAEKAAPWAALGCNVAVASVGDPAALQAAFRDVEGVFVINPPDYDPEPGFPQAHKIAAAVKQAIVESQPGRVVLLSTVGAQVTEFNLLNNGTIMEAALREVNVPVAMLRAAWFMENASWDVESARGGRIASFLQPADHAISMVATEDIALAATSLLGETWSGVRVVELSGPRQYSPKDLADAFSQTLGRPIEIELVPRSTWEELFKRQGMRNPSARIRMLDGFNEGWIDFERQDSEFRTGTTMLEVVVQQLVRRV